MSQIVDFTKPEAIVRKLNEFLDIQEFEAFHIKNEKLIRAVTVNQKNFFNLEDCEIVTPQWS
jgi:hypothetical protein